MPQDLSLQQAPEVVSMPIVGASEMRDSNRHAFPRGESKNVPGKMVQVGVDGVEAPLSQ
jgi:hypothetical protein